MSLCSYVFKKNMSLCSYVFKKKPCPKKPLSMTKKETWKFVLQLLLSVLSAVGAAFGVSSCMAG